MPTQLAVGTYFRFSYGGKQDYGVVVQPTGQYQLLDKAQVPVGTVVHRCVWVGQKKDMLESRGTEIKK